MHANNFINAPTVSLFAEITKLTHQINITYPWTDGFYVSASFYFP
jgi:hypothetical protein